MTRNHDNEKSCKIIYWKKTPPINSESIKTIYLTAASLHRSENWLSEAAVKLLEPLETKPSPNDISSSLITLFPVT